MNILKDLWDLLVITVAISCFAVFASLTLELGRSALDLHEQGFFSLAKYNRMLVGE